MKIIQRVRLIADKGKVLTNGNITASAVDCLPDEQKNWTEIQEPKNESEIGG